MSRLNDENTNKTINMLIKMGDINYFRSKMDLNHLYPMKVEEKRAKQNVYECSSSILFFITISDLSDHPLVIISIIKRYNFSFCKIRDIVKKSIKSTINLKCLYLRTSFLFKKSLSLRTEPHRWYFWNSYYLKKNNNNINHIYIYKNFAWKCLSINACQEFRSR